VSPARPPDFAFVSILQFLPYKDNGLPSNINRQKTAQEITIAVEFCASETPEAFFI